MFRRVVDFERRFIGVASIIRVMRDIALIMEEVNISETSVNICHTVRRNI
jgi:uncharacterized ion transporter superfamily protein YfcC